MVTLFASRRGNEKALRSIQHFFAQRRVEEGTTEGKPGGPNLLPHDESGGKEKHTTRRSDQKG
jgi:hypothetical protein